VGREKFRNSNQSYPKTPKEKEKAATKKSNVQPQHEKLVGGTGTFDRADSMETNFQGMDGTGFLGDPLVSHPLDAERGLKNAIWGLGKKMRWTRIETHCYTLKVK